MLTDVNVEDIEDAMEVIPLIIKSNWMKYSSLSSVWEDTDKNIQKEILQDWGQLIKDLYGTETSK